MQKTDTDVDRIASNGQALWRRGVERLKQGDYSAAESDFYRSIEIFPRDRRPQLLLNRLYLIAPKLTAQRSDAGVYCYCCEGFFPGFLPMGHACRLNAMCPRCGSLERHRLLWIYFKKESSIFEDKKRVKLLHIAPEPVFEKRFCQMPYIDYLSADNEVGKAMVQMDITGINLPDNTFDLIICSHVLEHVVDDRQAMSELRRCLNPTGIAILQVPFDSSREKTFEDLSVTTAEERARVFGQSDHVRIYGRDYAERLREVGFEVTERRLALDMDVEELRHLGVNASEVIHFCRKRLFAYD